MKEYTWRGVIASFIKENFLSIGLFVVILLMLQYGLRSAQAGSAQEELRIVRESITRSIVSCYAIEGVYPESFEYLQEHYNLHVDASKYIVQYSIFASNIMPDVTVIEVEL